MIARPGPNFYEPVRNDFDLAKGGDGIKKRIGRGGAKDFVSGVCQKVEEIGI